MFLLSVAGLSSSAAAHSEALGGFSAGASWAGLRLAPLSTGTHGPTWGLVFPGAAVRCHHIFDSGVLFGFAAALNMGKKPYCPGARHTTPHHFF